MMDFKNKKILLVGLGILGGGVSVANWLIKQGAKVTIFDAKPKEDLAESIKRIKGDARFLFKTCDKKEIGKVDAIVINQAVPPTNPEVVYAEKMSRPVYNEANIFYDICQKPIVAVTGTRGKTTTVNWTAHLLGKKALVAGNSAAEPLFKILPKTKGSRCSIVVNELPSFQLERFRHSPKISIVTNIFIDHLNRHGTMKNYVAIKKKIFENQCASDKLILNYDNKWTNSYLREDIKSELWVFSLKKLPKKMNGMYYYRNCLFLQTGSNIRKILNAKRFSAEWGSHNIANLEAAILAAYLAGEKIGVIKKRIKDLPLIKFRQEKIYASKKLAVINDTAATSPEGSIAAIKRFGSSKCILIAGGADAGLDYAEWARIVAKYISIKNLVLINGTATAKMLKEFSKRIDADKIIVKESLEECVDKAFENIKLLPNKSGATILFSPAAKSFEKFKNEFDRGEKFNKLVKNRLSKRE